MGEEKEVPKNVAYGILGLLAFALLFLIGILVSVWIVQIATPESPEDAARSISTAPVRRIRTDYGMFTIPGTSYIDGRDVNADPLLTLMYVNVYDFEKRRKMCRIPHGDKVELLDYASSRWKIKSGFCEDWVTWWFVNNARFQPVGEPIWDN